MNNDLNNQGNMVQPKQKNTIGTVGFVLSFLIPFVGFVCSIIGFKKSKETNSGKGLSVAGIIISIIFIVLNIMMYPKVLEMVNDYMDNPVNDRVEDEEDTHKDTLITKSIDELKAEGYKKYELSKGETLTRKIDNGLNELKEVTSDNINNLIFNETENNYDFKYDNNTFEYILDKSNEKQYQTINNVKLVKTNGALGGEGLEIYVFTETNELHYIFAELPYLEKSKLEYRQLKGKYNDVKGLDIDSIGAGSWNGLLIGEDGKYYNTDETLFDENISYLDGSNKVLMNGNVYVKNELQSFKYKLGLKYADNSINMIISEDNYLFEQNKSSWEKFSNSKIKSVLYKDDVVIVELENNKKYSFDYTYISTLR